MFENIYKNFINKIDAEFLVVLFAIILTLFIPEVFIAIMIYFITMSIIDIKNIYKIAWENPKDIHKPLSDDRGFGLPMIGFIIGGAIWWYLYSLNYFSSIIIELISALAIIILIPSLITSFVLVYSIALLQKYRKKTIN